MSKDKVDVGAKSKTPNVPKTDEDKREAKAGTYTLAKGHPTPFRRTVNLDGSSKSQKAPSAEPATVQLVFNPGEDYELSDVEAAGCKDLIERGFLVPANRDEKGRQRQPVSSPHTSADSEIAKLEKKVEDLAAENAELKAQLKNAPTVTMPAQVEQQK